MPIYEYRCAACGHHLEALQKMSEAPLRKCPDCGKSQLRRLVSASQFRLKGSGWYETDFKNKNETKRNLVETASADSGDSSAASEAKDAKAEAAAAPASSGDAKAAAPAAKSIPQDAARARVERLMTNAQTAFKQGKHAEARKLAVQAVQIAKDGKLTFDSKELTPAQLMARIDAAKEELFNLRFQLATGQLDNPSRIREVRHDVARIATVLREREIEVELDAFVAAQEELAEAREEDQ